MKDQILPTIKDVDAINSENLKKDAASLMKIIQDLDEKIAALNKARSKEKLKLRAITSKIVTLELKDRP